MRPITGAKLAAFATLVFLLVTSGAAMAQGNPQQLVKEMVYNELHANKHPNYWMYTDKDTESGTTKVKRVVQTHECWFRWEMSINGQPLTPAQEQQQRDKINKLVTDEQARQKNRAEINHDSQQATNLMKMLPDAFLYTEDGEQNGNIRLKFRPNPQFSPPTRPAKVFHNMEGTLLINKREKRLAGISGTLMSDVDFGWGILGKLYKGGTFKVQQTQVGPDDWEVTLLDVHMRGRVLFFHTIHEQQRESESDFQRVPDGITLQQAAALAEHGNLNASAQ